MEDKKQLLIDAQNLKKYPEFWALKKTMEAFCNDLDSLDGLEKDKDPRITLAEEVAGRIWAKGKITDLLSSLGLVDKSKPRVVDKTGE